MLQIDLKKTTFFLDGIMAKAENVEDGTFQVAECFNYITLYYVMCNLGNIFSLLVWM